MKGHLKVNVNGVEVNISIESLLKNKLVKFLKEENAFEKFCHNVKNYSSDTPEKIWSRKRKDRHINSMFIWSEAKEGHDYWSDLDYKFYGLNN
tara:strand:+ start:203 stop:481 length:279 start_codon:yes stop_codon:yes gene_type:complete